MTEVATKQDIARIHDEAQAPLPAEPAAGLMEVISRAASDPSVDVAKMRELLELKREVERDEAKRQFDLAMNEAQKEMAPIAADAANKQTSSRYATYYALDKALRPIYTERGFSVGYDTEDSPKENCVRVVCIVSRGGYERRHRADMPITTVGPQGKAVMTPTHATGSAITYGKRATLCMAFNIAIGQDDDGNAAGATAITDDEAKAFRKLCDDLDAEVAKICAHVRADTVESMTAAQLKKATQAVNAWARNQRREPANA